MIAAAVFLMSQAVSPAPAPPIALQFGFFRMAAFRQRVIESNCGADIDALEALRKRLANRYGKKAFAWPKPSESPPGDCRMVSSVFAVNFAKFRREAEAALATPEPVQGSMQQD